MIKVNIVFDDADIIAIPNEILLHIVGLINNNL